METPVPPFEVTDEWSSFPVLLPRKQTCSQQALPTLAIGGTILLLHHVSKKEVDSDMFDTIVSILKIKET